VQGARPTAMQSDPFPGQDDPRATNPTARALNLKEGLWTATHPTARALDRNPFRPSPDPSDRKGLTREVFF
jgi:hypothetical protein